MLTTSVGAIRPFRYQVESAGTTYILGLFRIIYFDSALVNEKPCVNSIEEWMMKILTSMIASVQVITLPRCGLHGVVVARLFGFRASKKLIPVLSVS